MNPSRELMAFFLAPTIATLIVTSPLLFFLGRDAFFLGRDAGFMLMIDAGIMLMIAVTISWGIAGLIGLPLLIFIRRMGWTKWFAFVIGGALLGAIGAGLSELLLPFLLVPWLLALAEFEQSAYILTVGLFCVAGAISGYLFWKLAGYRLGNESGNHA